MCEELSHNPILVCSHCLASPSVSSFLLPTSFLFCSLCPAHAVNSIWNIFFHPLILFRLTPFIPSRSRLSQKALSDSPNPEGHSFQSSPSVQCTTTLYLSMYPNYLSTCLPLSQGFSHSVLLSILVISPLDSGTEYGLNKHVDWLTILKESRPVDI